MSSLKKKKKQQRKVLVFRWIKPRVCNITNSSSLRLCRPMAVGTPADRFANEIPLTKLNKKKELNQCETSFIDYHIKTKRNCLSSFGHIRCTIDAIIKGIVNLVFTGYITRNEEKNYNAGVVF